MDPTQTTTTTTYLHRVDSSSTPRMIIVRQSSVKVKPTTSIKPSTTEQNAQQFSTLVTSVSTVKSPRKPLFNMRRRQVNDASSTGEKRLCTKENCLTCCKKFTAFMFSRVGLFFVMIGYVAFGGWLFQTLEARNEQDMRRSMGEKLNSTLYNLWYEILRVNAYPHHDKKGNFTLFATQALEKFEATVIREVQQGFDGRIRPDADADWNYVGAILYAVTLVSTIGYGHITTKTLQGKIATILYSAFGVPLMMLFVANIGSTMAKMFAFVFSRLTMIFCCRWKRKKKRMNLKNRSKNAQTTIILDEKMSIENSSTNKSSLKRNKNETSKEDFSASSKLPPPAENNPSFANTFENPLTDAKQLPADIRLNMLTGVPTDLPKSRSITSSTSTVGERSKDALVRINELIRQNSVPDVENKNNDDVFEDKGSSLPSMETDQRRKSDQMTSIQFYINETNKLTNSLEKDQTAGQQNINGTSPDDNSNKQAVLSQAPITTTTNEVIVKTEDPSRKSSKKKLKRSKSESTHNRKSRTKTNTNSESATPVSKDSEPTKSTRRRFFLRKIKKQSALESEPNKNDSLEQDSIETIVKPIRKQGSKSQSINEEVRSLPPPPDYEESTTNKSTPFPTVTWKDDQDASSTKKTFDFPTSSDLENEDEDFDEDEQMSVPLLVTVFVIPLYLTLGAILFNIWEDWGFLNSFYFCFITLTTIGFGDFVPGSALTVSAAKEKLISAALYILLGLVLIAMCFNLMKEQLSQKVKRVAGKWGISEF